MAFPINPKNNDVFNDYVFDSTKRIWKKNTSEAILPSKQTGTSNIKKIWVGNNASYVALTDKKENTLYFINEV